LTIESQGPEIEVDQFSGPRGSSPFHHLSPDCAHSRNVQLPPTSRPHPPEPGSRVRHAKIPL